MTKRKRQGRTSAKRLEKKIERENQRKNQAEVIDPVCKCGGRDMVEDDHSGDVVCTSCGLVQEGSGLMIRVNDMPSAKRYSADYARKTHFEQKIKQLTIRDVKISKKVLDGIVTHCAEVKKDLRSLSKKDISSIVQCLTKVCKNGKSKKLCDNRSTASKISRSYLQIKDKLGILEKDYCLNKLDEDIWDVLRMRFDMVSKEFDLMKKEGLVERENIINLNFLIRKFLEAEDPDYLELFDKYIPQFKKNKKKKNEKKDNSLIYENMRKRLRNKIYLNLKDDKEYIFDW